MLSAASRNAIVNPMSEKGLFYQNVIALVWDFDKTLSPEYMQRPLFEAYDIDDAAFWAEVNALPAYYAKSGIVMHPDTAYLNHLLSYVAHGRMPGLNNAKLRSFGKEIRLFPGLPEFFPALKGMLSESPYRDADIRLEHYVVSTGLAELIRGNAIYPEIDGLWASEFVEVPAGPGFDAAGKPGAGEISQIAGALDNTTKTRALFEINKGVGKHPDIKVNTTIPEEERRVPFKNMIYIADGPSDIPSFSVVKRHGGKAYAVYNGESDGQFNQVADMHAAGRVNDYGEADYREGTKTHRWLTRQVRLIADSIINQRTQTTSSKVGAEPRHLHD